MYVRFRDRNFIIKYNFSFIRTALDKNDSIKFELNPQVNPKPQVLVKLDNNSMISTSDINRNNTYYLMFSSELTCRISTLKNQTKCFYYPASSNFIDIEYNYDEIKHARLTLLNRTLHRIFTFFIITIVTIIIVIIIFILVTYFACKDKLSF